MIALSPCLQLLDCIAAMVQCKKVLQYNDRALLVNMQKLSMRHCSVDANLLSCTQVETVVGVHNAASSAINITVLAGSLEQCKGLQPALPELHRAGDPLIGLLCTAQMHTVHDSVPQMRTTQRSAKLGACCGLNVLPPLPLSVTCWESGTPLTSCSWADVLAGVGECQTM